ncbi:MAG: GTP cyclohydrolase I FolE [Segniliparus sp.]|uniref:GTP cyclohydrolase I FolE n=1 Tax=Segniliparus sp. TaxID=2804064 RepID=UPI003F3E1FF4
MSSSDEPASALDKQAPAFDEKRAQAAVRELLLAVGEDPDRPGLTGTPARVAKLYRELFSGLEQDPKDVLGESFAADHDELVLVKDITVQSVCEHHLLSFHGAAHVGYIPGVGGSVVGFSTLSRLVDLYARRPQIQERLTSQVADALMEHLRPRGVIVVVEAEHLCMQIRGDRQQSAKVTTSAVRGLLRTNPSSRAEALGFILRP